MCSGSCPHRHTPPPELSFSLRRAIFTSIPIVVVLILLPAIAFASPPDQLWIAGIYDGADGDESVSLVYETAGVEATPTRPVPLLPRSSEILVVSSPSSVHGPVACPSTRAPPAAQAPISYSVHSGPQFPATFPANRVTQQHFLSTTCPLGKIEEASRSGSLDGSPVSGRTYAVSTPRLKQLSALTAGDVQKGQIPGVVMLVARNGKVVHADAIGVQDPKTGTPMKMDSIFRIASMTKPLVTVGALTLVEEGRIQLPDPVSRHLPELKGMQVGVEKPDASGKASLELVPAQREMTVQDLLRHTSGLTYGIFGKSLVTDEYNNARLSDPAQSSVEMVTKLSKLPLAFQPGTTWDYSMSTDVLGALIERVSGQTLDIFLAERVTKPLGMKDTGFWVDTAQQSRIAEPFDSDPDTKAPARVPDVRKQPRFLSGGGGMVSTAPDYLRFAQMLLNGGELDGVRILSRTTIKLMTSDHLGTRVAAPLQPSELLLGSPGYTFGLGFAVRQSDGVAGVPGSVGEFMWAGYAGTFFWVDPQEEIVGVYMTQAPSPIRAYYRKMFKALVYQALVD